jgi:catechol 2,3-dioxygenase-like lactoylglutathione lyase family enzyme
MLHHISLGVRDLERAAAFYDAVLAPLGYARVWTHPTAVGYGEPGGGDRLAIKQADGARPPAAGFHVAFCAPTRAAVSAFHEAAMRAGGSDNGPPGPRPQYGPEYFAAFVVDPDGHRLEAVLAAP